MLVLAAPSRGQTQTQTHDRVNLSLYGMPGHVEMPSALMQPDGTLSFSSNIRDGVSRNALTFQISPRISGSFRYAYLRNFAGPTESLYDRSFDLRYQAVREGAAMPAIAVGLQDFGGTGVFGAEYLVASKRLRPDVTASAGIGWGRLGSSGSFRNPLSVIDGRFDRRPDVSGISDTGRVSLDRFFRGKAAVFGGVNWQATERLHLSFEYSSDAQRVERRTMGFDHRTPFNIAASYRLKWGGEVGLALLHGSAATLSYSFGFDPAQPRFPSGREAAPPMVVPRDDAMRQIWRRRAGPSRDDLVAAFRGQGLRITSLQRDGNSVTVGVSNTVWGAGAQAIGRAARLLTAHMPPDVETFRIRPTDKGMALAEVVIRRADMEQLEYAPDGAWQSYVRAQIGDATRSGAVMAQAYPGMAYRLAPYLSPAIFDPDNPVRADFGAQAAFEGALAPGVVLSGALRKRILGNRDQVTRVSNSILPHVRSDVGLFDRAADPEISYLTVEHFFRPGRNLYGRATLGYLERMYGGISGEVLWKPVASRLGLGIEMNYARQRDFDVLFGFQDYDVFTGHASAYYDFGKSYIGQLDVGRYLAGDTGFTVSLDRAFGNGFRVGAFFTLTDAGFKDFGEGSFDKGIRLSIPVNWLVGEASRNGFATTIRPVQRDGGARLHVRNRLHDVVRDYHEPELGARWARFWR